LTTEKNIWKKRSVFFNLPYWSSLDVAERWCEVQVGRRCIYSSPNQWYYGVVHEDTRFTPLYSTYMGGVSAFMYHYYSAT
jgi:hypothetical protein